MEATRAVDRDAPADPLLSSVRAFLKPALTGMASRGSGGSLVDGIRQAAHSGEADPTWMVARHDDLFAAIHHRGLHDRVGRLHAALGLSAERLAFVDGFDVVMERFMRAFTVLPGPEVEARLCRHLAGDVIEERPMVDCPSVHLAVTAAAHGALQGVTPPQAGQYLPALTTLGERHLDGRFASMFDASVLLRAIWKGAETTVGRTRLQESGMINRLRTVVLRSLWSHQQSGLYPAWRGRAFAAHAWCALAGLPQRVSGCLTNALRGTARLPDALASGRPAIREFLASLSEEERSLLVGLGMREQSVISCHAIGVIARTGTLSESA
jgi:hypothetical protein